MNDYRPPVQIRGRVGNQVLNQVEVQVLDQARAADCDKDKLIEYVRFGIELLKQEDGE